MLDTYLPTTLPPSGVVADVNPAAAEAITAFRQLDATLPPRRSAEQANELEHLRGRALSELGDSFFADLDGEEAELLDTLRGELDRLSALWGRMEQIRALRAWRAHPTNYSIAQIPALTVSTGNGYSRTVSSREMIRALSDAIGGR